MHHSLKESVDELVYIPYHVIISALSISCINSNSYTSGTAENTHRLQHFFITNFWFTYVCACSDQPEMSLRNMRSQKEEESINSPQVMKNKTELVAH